MEFYIFCYGSLFPGVAKDLSYRTVFFQNKMSEVGMSSMDT